MTTRNSRNWPLPSSSSRLGAGDTSLQEDDRHVSDGASETQVIGTTTLYKDGQLRFIPMPTPDPKDPLNMKTWRKWFAIGTLCFFGSLGLSAEIIIGSLLPVFLLEYSGVDPRILNKIDFVKSSGGHSLRVNPMSVVPPGVEPVPIGKIALLATIPLLGSGIASYFLVPLSIAVGRRPVLLFAAACAWAGGIWAGLSNSLQAHQAARCIQGLGVGAVEALIPLIVQDMVFIHQRNRAMSVVVSSQGVVIIALGIAAPYVAANYTWRWLYFITSGLGILAWILLIVGLPETRWKRSKEELSGARVYPIREGENRPDLDPETYGRRTFWTEFGVFQFGFDFKGAGISMLDTIRTTFFPAVIWCVLTNSVLVITNQATQQISAFALLAQGWQFQYTGLSVVPFFAAAILVFILGGPVADRVSNSVTKWNGGGREAEHHLVNLIFPFVAGVAGCFIFGYAGDNNLHWGILLTGSFFIVFGFLSIMTILNVFIVECYPMWAGPVLVNVSSLRLIIAFFLASQATVWISQRGLLWTFAIYAEVMLVLSLGIPGLFFFGKRMRQWTAGKVYGRRVEKQREPATPSTV
ncbi:hypothetical protein jhhlp_001648 [Lomentospora prolificans]|uniref:Major facilitator superfamily (MFS) profile domain-containing protein n=1 Tax=Lomentospora prolificans TaxID=41688 RepID=A0A2N3NIV4_9PEZI|nr:hypothetical protein jhhlp_001648 [Lomentospora prolificans]